MHAAEIWRGGGRLTPAGLEVWGLAVRGEAEKMWRKLGLQSMAKPSQASRDHQVDVETVVHVAVAQINVPKWHLGKWKQRLTPA